MKLPNKLYSYHETVLSKFHIVLNTLDKKGHLTISELYALIGNDFNSITEFIEVTECLFILGKIEYNYQTRRIHYVA